MIEYIKEPFRAGGINDLAMYMGDLSAMLTFIYFVKSDYLGFGFWFSWALFWLPT